MYLFMLIIVEGYDKIKEKVKTQQFLLSCLAFLLNVSIRCASLLLVYKYYVFTNYQ